MKYVAVLNYNGQTIHVANSNNNEPRIFDDPALAETVAKIFELPYKVLPASEYIVDFKEENDSGGV